MDGSCKLQFRPDLRSDSLNDTRFISPSTLKDTSKWGDVGNYRPISLLSNVSKVLEKFFVGRLEAEAETNNLIS